MIVSVTLFVNNCLAKVFCMARTIKKESMILDMVAGSQFRYLNRASPILAILATAVLVAVVKPMTVTSKRLLRRQLGAVPWEALWVDSWVALATWS